MTRWRVKLECKRNPTSQFVCLVISLCLTIGWSTTICAQRARAKQTAKPTSVATPLPKLRDEFVSATKNYKASLEKLRISYEKNVATAEKHLALSRALYVEGLIAKNKLAESEQALASAKDKVAEVQQQLNSADMQIANALVEADTEAKMGSLAKARKGALISTTSYIRYNGFAAWSLSDSWKVEKFFQNTFKRPLPIGVFGQGAIHDRWRLDHHNAMDLSVNPDGVEGQALIGFLRSNGIPFSAFRQAIPGTATGPHIHVGQPSHRY